MKLNVARIFQVIALSCVVIIFVGYWSGLGSYFTIETNHYWQQAIFLFHSKAETDGGFNSTDTFINQWYTNIYKVTIVTLASTVTSTTTSWKNASTTTTTTKITTTPGPTVSHNTSTPALKQSNLTLLITSAGISSGRLGNQLFKYASLLGVAHAQNRKMFIYPGTDLERTFKLHHVDSGRQAVNWTTIMESNPVSFDPKLMKLPLKNVKIAGYLQSFLYFSNITDIVRQEFTFRDDIASTATSILNNVLVNYRTSLVVGVHARRGDFLILQSQGYGVPQKSYFFKAFDWIRSRFPGRNVTFIVASDDLTWCQNNLVGKDVILMPPATAAVHLAVLASCDHVIISGGTYGWWGGWLAGGEVIYYKGYLTKGTSLGDLLTPKLYYPPLWVVMDN